MSLKISEKISVYDFPDQKGYFGRFGGKFVPETLMPALFELEESYFSIKSDPDFQKTLNHYLDHFVGRPTPLYFAEELTKKCGGGKIYLKREDLTHTGSHKINNTLGQVLLAKKMGKTRIIAETGAGQHGVATATACALFGMDCLIYMGAKDIQRQSMNVHRMELLGAEVIAVESGSKTLKDAINEAIRDWVAHSGNTHYCIGSVVGPHPYPMMVRDFQSVIGMETKEQILEKEGRLPDMLIASVGGGSNSIGLFHSFLESDIKMVGVEGGGTSLDLGKHAATLTQGQIGVLHGTISYLLQDEDGQVLPTSSISAGLDYPGVGPEHSYLKDSKRVSYTSINDEQALHAFSLLSMTEGIIPALESAHAVAYAVEATKKKGKKDILIVNLSGRGDKDLDIVIGGIG